MKTGIADSRFVINIKMFLNTIGQTPFEEQKIITTPDNHIALFWVFNAAAIQEFIYIFDSYRKAA